MSLNSCRYAHNAMGVTKQSQSRDFVRSQLSSMSEFDDERVTGHDP